LLEEEVQMRKNKEKINMLSDFYKQNKNDKIRWIDDLDSIGKHMFSFDKIKISFENGILSLTSDTYKLLSYTGVSDVKGIDIYEGDIIEYGYLLDGKIYSYEKLPFTLSFPVKPLPTPEVQKG